MAANNPKKHGWPPSKEIVKKKKKKMQLYNEKQNSVLINGK